MGYYLRYFVADERPVETADIARALEQAGSGCILVGDGSVLELRMADAPCATIEINTGGEPGFDEERDEFIELVEMARGRRKRDVLKVLREARGVVAIQVHFGDRDTEEALEFVDPILVWLVANRRGLVQADGEGFYEGTKLILKERW